MTEQMKVALMDSRECCPDCGRLKARNADDCVAGDCDKWYAVRDLEARKECERIAKATGFTDTTASSANRGERG